LSSAIPILRHLCFSHQGHPEELFREMSRLAGALCTFGINSNPAQLPLYDHQNLESCFDALDAHIRAHLELLAPTNCVLIPLQHTSDYFYNGTVADTRCLGHARWFLAVRANVDEAALIRLVPKVVKVCSARFVPDLVRRAVPGMRLTHVPTPPASVSPRLDTQYFSLTLEGPCWDHIVSTKQVGCYVPGEISNAEVGVVVLLEN
jgi:type VI secretion system protein ImpJ